MVKKQIYPSLFILLVVAAIIAYAATMIWVAKRVVTENYREDEEIVAQEENVNGLVVPQPFDGLYAEKQTVVNAEAKSLAGITLELLPIDIALIKKENRIWNCDNTLIQQNINSYIEKPEVASILSRYSSQGFVETSYGKREMGFVGTRLFQPCTMSLTYEGEEIATDDMYFSDSGQIHEFIKDIEILYESLSTSNENEKSVYSEVSPMAADGVGVYAGEWGQLQIQEKSVQLRLISYSEKRDYYHSPYDEYLGNTEAQCPCKVMFTISFSSHISDEELTDYRAISNKED